MSEKDYKENPVIKRMRETKIIKEYLFLENIKGNKGDLYVLLLYKINPSVIRSRYEFLRNGKTQEEIKEIDDLEKEIKENLTDEELMQIGANFHREGLKRDKINGETGESCIEDDGGDCR